MPQEYVWEQSLEYRSLIMFSEPISMYESQNNQSTSTIADAQYKPMIISEEQEELHQSASGHGPRRLTRSRI